jgi:hypothetical protein
MRVRRPWFLAVFLLIPTAAQAHGHRADFYAAVSVAKGSTLWGTQQTLGLTSPRPRSHDMSIVGDLGVYKGTDSDLDVTRITFMGGVRWWGPGTAGYKHRAYGQILAGGVHDHRGEEDATDPALAFGIGYEFNPHGEERDSGLAARAQIDYVKVFQDGESFPRFSAGIVYRLGR